MGGRGVDPLDGDRHASTKSFGSRFGSELNGEGERRSLRCSRPRAGAQALRKAPFSRASHLLSLTRPNPLHTNLPSDCTPSPPSPYLPLSVLLALIAFFPSLRSPLTFSAKLTSAFSIPAIPAGEAAS